MQPYYIPIKILCQMIIPQEYKRWFESLPFHEVSFGYSGLTLYAPSELDAGQIGYSRSVEGESFCDGEPGAWKAEWIVIGHDTLLGDPLILDIASHNMPVMTSAHGEGSWAPRVIAASLAAFAFGLETVHRLSAGRQDPVQLEQNPLPEKEREQALQEIQKNNNAEIDLEFWSLILESGLP
jgi:hypothetical protein